LVTAGLADLNDHLPKVLKAEKEGAAIAKRFHALSEFEISPESPKTHKNKKAMDKRSVVFKKVEIGKVKYGTVTVSCEWHLKIRKTTDRIHYYNHTQSNRIWIGIFTAHLPT